jgi:hypothetical protein
MATAQHAARSDGEAESGSTGMPNHAETAAPPRSLTNTVFAQYLQITRATGIERPSANAKRTGGSTSQLSVPQ